MLFHHRQGVDDVAASYEDEIREAFIDGSFYGFSRVAVVRAGHRHALAA